MGFKIESISKMTKPCAEALRFAKDYLDSNPDGNISSEEIDINRDGFFSYSDLTKLLSDRKIKDDYFDDQNLCSAYDELCNFLNTQSADVVGGLFRNYGLSQAKSSNLPDIKAVVVDNLRGELKLLNSKTALFVSGMFYHDPFQPLPLAFSVVNGALPVPKSNLDQLNVWSSQFAKPEDARVAEDMIASAYSLAETAAARKSLTRQEWVELIINCVNKSE